MIIFQMATSGEVGGFTVGAALLPDFQPTATTFRSNDYIHRLNRTLQAEMRAISAYRAYASSLPTQTEVPAAGMTLLIDANGAEHQAAGRDLVRLIIANRGIPEDRSALSLGLTKTFISLCARVPTRFFERASVGTLSSLERHLKEQYARLLKNAPARDLGVLGELERQTIRRESELVGLLSRP